MTDDTDLAGELSKRAETVNAALDAQFPDGAPKYLYDASRYLLVSGGKRIRPAMLLLVSEALGREQGDEAVLPAALAVEVVHTLSLIHDDIIDADDLRRGVSTVHVEWDQPTGILAGDLLYARAFDLLLDPAVSAADRQTCLSIMTRACRQLCEGQAMDIELERADDVSEETYTEMVAKKTGALFAGATEMGALLGGGDEAVRDDLRAYGRKVGIAFQHYDDILDLTTPSETLGKTRGSDLREGKRTLITIHARRQGVETAPDGELGGETIDRLLDELEDAGSIAYARERAHEYAAEAKSHLDALPPGEATDLLAAIADHVVEREY